MVPMPLMAVSIGLALVVIHALIAHDGDRITAAVIAVCCVPFVLYWLPSNRSADGPHFVLDKHPAPSLTCWARRAVIFCMVLAFLFAQPGQAEAVRSTAGLVAGALLLVLLATPRWGNRFAPMAWAAVAVQFVMPPLHPWLFLGTLLVVAVLAIWRHRRRQLSNQPGRPQAGASSDAIFSIFPRTTAHRKLNCTSVAAAFRSRSRPITPQMDCAAQ
ncbi:hypothetical protein [Massilia timonae]|nr:hypothetical protein [Massilia timonae]